MAAMFLFRILSKLPSQKVTLFRSTMTAFRPMQTVSFLSELPFGEHGGLLLRTRTACTRRARAGPRAREDPSYKAALTERSWRRLCSPRTLQASCTGPGSSTAQHTDPPERGCADRHGTGSSLGKRKGSAGSGRGALLGGR